MNQIPAKTHHKYWGNSK